MMSWSSWTPGIW